MRLMKQNEIAQKKAGERKKVSYANKQCNKRKCEDIFMYKLYKYNNNSNKNYNKNVYAILLFFHSPLMQCSFYLFCFKKPFVTTTNRVTREALE